jgi:putative DNA methylase
MEKNRPNYHSPIIRNVPKEEERLIDTGMLHFESSIAGYNERYHRGETSHTIHVWWARRPHSAMRSLVYASLCKNKSEKAASLMAQLAMNCNDEIVDKAKKILREQYKSIPRVLDMFGGGGTIPFEAKRLGLDSYSIDANQLSVFIQKCNMLYADKIDLKQAEEKIKEIGEKILNNLKQRTDWLYPLRKKSNEKVFGYIWTYRITCPHCGYKSILSKRPWLSKKKRHVGFIASIDEASRSETLHVQNLQDSEEPFAPHWERHTGIYRCPNCNQVIKNIDVLQCEDVITAIIKNKSGYGKDFFDAKQKDAIPDELKIKAEENRVLKNLNIALPNSNLPIWSGIVNPALYGIKTHADFLNKRQRLLLLYLIDELSTQYTILVEKDIDMAKFVIGALSSLIDQVVDWNCRLSMWISQNEQVGRGFCGPGIAMLFDYAETDQVLGGPANLWSKLKRINKGIKSFENCKGHITIKHAHAQKLPFESNFFDAIITDPPYYDNIYYSVLADFFYTWKKPLLKRIEPELFAPQITDSNYELVASSHRIKKGQSAHEEYCKQLSMAFSEAARVLKEDGVFSFVYSHSSVKGWESVIQAYRQSKFLISSAQPLSIERKSRPRAILSQAVNTCVTLVARKSHEKKQPISLAELLRKTQIYIDKFGKQLIDSSGWSQPDAGLAVIACVVGLLANSSRIDGCASDADALIAASKLIKVTLPEFSIKVRNSL